MKRRLALPLLIASLVPGTPHWAQAPDSPKAPEPPKSAAAQAGSTAALPKPAAGPSAPVYCGSFTCFRIRVTVKGKSPDERASAAIDTINKYLGGAVGKVTTRPDGKNVRLLLNNDLVAVVTPEDAAAESLKTAALLADRWSKKLALAFEASKAQK